MTEIDLDHMQMRDSFIMRTADNICNNNILFEDWRIIISNLSLILEKREEYLKQWTNPGHSTLIDGAE